MSIDLDQKKIREYLENFDLQSLFINELGWDRAQGDFGILDSTRIRFFCFIRQLDVGSTE